MSQSRIKLENHLVRHLRNNKQSSYIKLISCATQCKCHQWPAKPQAKPSHSAHNDQFGMMYSPEAHLCGLWQATVCRNEHTLLMRELDLQPRQPFLRTVSSDSRQRWAHAEAYSMLMSPMNAVVPNTAKQKQWLINCQSNTCSQLDVHVQSRDWFVWTVTSNSLQKWANSWTNLNAGIQGTAQRLMSANCIKQQSAEIS